MCGITALYRIKEHADEVRRIAQSMEKLSHRGPDDCGKSVNETGKGVLSMGHTRLSIIDLSASGQQPMDSENGRYRIIFNGEIYNYRELRDELRQQGYRFNTETDTEVLIYCWDCWGISCLDKLKGMFAFILYDRKTNKLWVVRDAFGIKPLFYHQNSKGFSFSSEVPSLLKLLDEKPAFNMQSCYDYLMFGQYDNNCETFYEGIKQLLPGYYLSLDLGETPQSPKPVCWWKPTLRENSQISFKKAAEEIREQFIENIRLHLRSDVPLGAALSGGIDSSAVVCVMRYLYPEMPIHTFSYIARNSNADEERWIDLVNNHVHAIPHKIEFAPEDLISDLDDLIRTQGEPFSSTSIYAQYRVFKKVRDEGITVTLDGQGADELLAGYDGYPISRFKSLIETRDFKHLYELIKHWKTVHNRSAAQVVTYLRSALVNEQLRDFSEKMGRRPSANWLKYDFLNEQQITLNHRPPALSSEGKGRRLSEALREALTHQSLQALLRHGDRNSMRWSIESRVPFLTTDFAEYILQLPENYLLSDRGETKHIFREAMRGIVPDAILDRQDKIGFQTPEKEILHTINGQILESIEPLSCLPFLDTDQLRAELKKELNGKKTSRLRVWHLFNLSRFISLSEESF